jgi:hypothetical protein
MKVLFAQDAKFRVSTEDGDTYTIEASSLQEAQRIARKQEGNKRYTVYEDKPYQSTYRLPHRR